jgi:NADPH2:quinone reductase
VSEQVPCWSIEEFGEPRDVLRRAETTLRGLGSDDVRIDIEAIGLNFLDVSMCRGDYASKPPLPLVPGAEFTGRVTGVGSAVTNLSIGQRVAALNPAAQGAFAVAAVVSAGTAYPVPDEMPAEHAAAILVTYQTAWFALIRRAALAAGEWLLVHAGAGGVGTAAIQLARSRGARIIATAGTGEKAAVCRDLGADVAVDYRRQDFVTAALDATNGRGVDVVFDPVGGDVFARSLECSALEARLIPIGWASGERPRLQAEELLGRNVTVVGLAWGSTFPGARPDLVEEVHAELLGAYAARRIAPFVPRVWSFDQLPDAVQALADGAVRGKAVVAVVSKPLLPAVPAGKRSLFD